MSIQVPLTFLDLCQRTQQECGVSGALMSTVVGATGEALRLTSWVSNAWIDIQNSHQDWDFLRTTTSFVTIAGKGAYSLAECGISPASTFNYWVKDSVRNFVTADGVASEVFMEYMGSYDRWRDAYLYGALRQVKTRPIVFTIAPDKSLCLGPIADAGYTVIADYFIAPQPMVVDADTPQSVSSAKSVGGTLATDIAFTTQGTMPTQWNMLIVYHAMMAYGAYENAPEVYNRGENEFNKLMRRITADRLPEIKGSGALA
jgi:hypothetical protein